MAKVIEKILRNRRGEELKIRFKKQIVEAGESPLKIRSYRLEFLTPPGIEIPHVSLSGVYGDGLPVFRTRVEEWENGLVVWLGHRAVKTGKLFSYPLEIFAGEDQTKKGRFLMGDLHGDEVTEASEEECRT